MDVEVLVLDTVEEILEKASDAPAAMEEDEEVLAYSFVSRV